MLPMATLPLVLEEDQKVVLALGLPALVLVDDIRRLETHEALQHVVHAGDARGVEIHLVQTLL